MHEIRETAPFVHGGLPVQLHPYSSQRGLGRLLFSWKTGNIVPVAFSGCGYAVVAGAWSFVTFYVAGPDNVSASASARGLVQGVVVGSYRQVRQPALDRLLDFRLLTVGSMKPDWEAHVHDRGGKWEIDGK